MDPELVLFRENGENKNTVIQGNEYKRIYEYFPNKFYFFLMVISAILSGILREFMFYFLGDFSAALSTETDFMKSVNKVCLKLVYVTIAVIITTVITFIFRGVCTPLFKFALKKKLFETVVEQPLSFFDETSTGVLISRISADITLLQKSFFDNIFDFIQVTSSGITCIVLLFTLNWKLTLIGLCCFPVIMVIYIVCMRIVSKKWEPFNENSTITSARAEEVISQFRTVKSFDCEEDEYNRYCNGVTLTQDLFTKASAVHAIKNGLSLLLIYCALTAICYYGPYLIYYKNENFSTGKFTALVSILTVLSMQIPKVSSFIDQLQKGKYAAVKVLALLDRKPEQDRKEGNEMKDVKGKIEFQNVGFKYASRDEWAVRNLSFTINPGETVAFVGESGCGKTTTLSLIQKFYEVQEGKILIDDVDLTTLSQVSLRSQIAIVPQSPVIFSMTAEENIRYSNKDAAFEDVAEAAKIGNADGFIKDLKDSYKTLVEENTLSGGQKQRICISRAIVTKAPILLLDEATASLDTESEQKVQESIDEFRKGKTAIIVAHRLATVINADRIFVFKDGKIVETGTHKELLSKKGHYAKLIKHQL